MTDKRTPYMKSNFDRVKDDNYRTIDSRCVYGLLQHFPLNGRVVDVCAPSGSGIVDTLLERQRNAFCVGDAFTNLVAAEWIVTNPPYTRPLVDNIIRRQIKRIMDREVGGVAILLRDKFDYAKIRADIFEHKFYFGQIKLRFRPWWSEVHEHQPFHTFVWHIWHIDAGSVPIVMYSNGE